jgi:hypothetical protein
MGFDDKPAAGGRTGTQVGELQAAVTRHRDVWSRGHDSEIAKEIECGKRADKVGRVVRWMERSGREAVYTGCMEFGKDLGSWRRERELDEGGVCVCVSECV